MQKQKSKNQGIFLDTFIEQDLNLEEQLNTQDYKVYEEQKEAAILNYMDSFDSSYPFHEQNRFLCFLNHYSYIFARISRALDYQLDKFVREDFIINLESYTLYNQSIQQILCNILPFLQGKLLEISKIIKNDFIQRKISILLGIGEEYLRSRITLGAKYPVSQNWKFDIESKLYEDLTAIDNIYEIFIKRPQVHLSLKVVDYSKKANVTYMIPFMGFAGKPINQIIRIKMQTENIDTSGVYNDFRGVIATGSKCNVLYVCWHGSCQEYDWHCNLDQTFISPTNDFLEFFPQTFKIHQGFANVLDISWKTNQNVGSNQVLTLGSLFYQELQDKQIMFHTGHSQGAAVAEIAAIYSTYTLGNKSIRGKFYSTPRQFDKKTSAAINTQFERIQQKGDFLLIRQNVFGDPVPLSFESPRDFLKRYFRLLINDKGFQTALQKETSQNVGSIGGGVVWSLMEQFVIKPLNNDFKGDFIAFLIDLTNPKKLDPGIDLLFDNLSKMLQKTKFKDLPPAVIKKLGLDQAKNQEKLNGQFIKGVCHNLGQLFSPQFPEHNLEDIVFDSEYNHSFKKLYEEKQRKAFLEKGFSDHFNSIKKGIENKIGNEKTDSQKFQDDQQMKFLKRALKAMLIHNMEQKFFLKELSCLGEILEGVMYFASDYGDVGTLFLDHLNYHEGNIRVQSLNLFENIFGKQKQEFNFNSIDKEEAKDATKDKILEYFAPYHYGQKDLDGCFDPLLVEESHDCRMYGYGKYFQTLNFEQQMNEYYTAGLLKNKKLKQQQQLKQLQEVQKQYTKDEDQNIILKRIEQKITFINSLLQWKVEKKKQFEIYEQDKKKHQESINSTANKFKNFISSSNTNTELPLPEELIGLNEQFVRNDKINISLENIKTIFDCSEQVFNQNNSQEQDNVDLNNQVKISYFLSSLLKVMIALYINQPDEIETQLVQLYQQFWNQIYELSLDQQSHNVGQYLLIHQEQFLKQCIAKLNS